MARRWTSLGGLLPRSLSGLVTDVLTPPRSARPNHRHRELPSTPGRPIASVLHPTARRARRVVYAPDLAGWAHAGEVVWTWVVDPQQDSDGADLPVLVVGRDEETLLGLLLSDDPTRDGDPNWVAVGHTEWTPEPRPNWVRVDHVLEVPEAGIRREGAILDRPAFDRVAHCLCAYYQWT